ncbi:hypothetical protein LCGC14_2774150, partial [marine sediment metagenome]
MQIPEKPDRKVGLGALAIGVPTGIVLAWVIGLTGVVVPAEVAAAMGGIVSA